MPRHTRYQGLIVNEDRVLLIKHRLHATGYPYTYPQLVTLREALGYI